MSSSMSPRERVLEAINHRQPDRIPFAWGFGPTPEMTSTLIPYFAAKGVDFHRLLAATNDILRIGAAYVGPELKPGADIWGVRRKTSSYGSGSYDEIAYSPLASIETVVETNAYPWPSVDWFDFSRIAPVLDAADKELPRAVCIWGGNPFELYCWMTGLEEAMIRLATMPEVVVAALDHITEYCENWIRMVSKTVGSRLDIVFLADDLGGQNGLLMSVSSYERIIQPFHRRLTSLIRNEMPQAKSMFHSDGSVIKILPSLIDAGVDILEAVQLDCAGMDPERLKAEFGNRLAFHGAISVQALLPHGSAEEVSCQCASLVRILGAGGGYIAAPSHAIQVGTPPANVDAMLRAVLGDTDYDAALESARIQTQ